jgi:hypothetical protein
MVTYAFWELAKHAEIPDLGPPPGPPPEIEIPPGYVPVWKTYRTVDGKTVCTGPLRLIKLERSDA